MIDALEFISDKIGIIMGVILGIIVIIALMLCLQHQHLQGQTVLN